MPAREINFDGLVGPTHHYGGLAWGNVASEKSQGTSSNPRAAALQGLEKMNFCHKLGLLQAVLPPHERPHLISLEQMGFGTKPEKAIEKAHKEMPGVLSALYSASSMWTANLGTMCPGVDAGDGLVHFTPANLCTQLHRSIEAPFNYELLKKVFPTPSFEIHKPLAPVDFTADEGAANHLRLGESHDQKGLQIFIYGRHGLSALHPHKDSFPCRQSRDASLSIGRLHKLDKNNVYYQAQNPDVIQSGVFHNDVISVANENVLLYHESAFADKEKFLTGIKNRWDSFAQKELYLHEVSSRQVSVSEAVDTYLFNSQLVTLPGGSMAVIAPEESRANPHTKEVLDSLVQKQGPIAAVHYLDLKQSMRNGGGPACLRFKVVLTDQELKQIHPGILWSKELYEKLKAWVNRHYRDKLTSGDLGDIRFYHETRDALQELTEILDLGDIYPFRRN